MAELILYVILAILIAIFFGVKRVLSLERRIAGLEGRKITKVTKKSVRKK